MLFVTIACGIISGFHATQNPIVARIERSEKNGRQTFYGMMVLEGVIAMIWAAAAMLFYERYPEWLHSGAGVQVLQQVVATFIPSQVLGVDVPGPTIVLLSVVMLAVTTGDAALRIVRTSVAELFGVRQRITEDRVLLCIPIFALCGAVVFWSNVDPDGFKKLWNYFSWTNQIMAVCGLSVTTVYLASKGKNFWISLLPCAFMLFIVLLYFFWAIFGFAWLGSALVSFLLALAICVRLVRHGTTLAKNPKFNADAGTP
jgi:carbon starvation protein CstA